MRTKKQYSVCILINPTEDELREKLQYIENQGYEIAYVIPVNGIHVASKIFIVYYTTKRLCE